MLYYGALTGHFGWYVQKPEADTDRSKATISAQAGAQARRPKKKRVWDWIVDPRLLYGQMVKRYVRRKLHEVTRRMMIGDIAEYIRILRAHGFSGLIQTAYIERQNLQMRMSVSPLIRRTWSLVCSELALARRLELQRGTYHFVKPHGGLRLAMAQPILREGQRIPQRYQQQSPASAKPPRGMAAGLTNHIWRLEETLLFPLPAPDIPALPPAQEPIMRRKRSKSEGGRSLSKFTDLCLSGASFLYRAQFLFIPHQGFKHRWNSEPTDTQLSITRWIYLTIQFVTMSSRVFTNYPL